MTTRIGGAKAKENAAILGAQIDSEIAKAKATLFQSAADKVTTVSKAVESDKGAKSYEKTHAEWSNMMSSVMKEFERAGKITFREANTPENLPGSKKRELKAINANIAAQLVGKVPGLKSNVDFEEIIIPLLPVGSDSESTVRAKMRNFNSFLHANAPGEYLMVEQKKWKPQSLQTMSASK
jgi:hypothetical protein